MDFNTAVFIGTIYTLSEVATLTKAYPGSLALWAQDPRAETILSRKKALVLSGGRSFGSCLKKACLLNIAATGGICSFGVHFLCPVIATQSSVVHCD